jgi:hypothetical protein
MFVTWCYIALISVVSASLIFAGSMWVLDWWCHRRHKPEHASCGQPPEERIVNDGDTVPLK